MRLNHLWISIKCFALLILCTLGAVSNAVFAGSAEEKATPLTIEHTPAKPNKPLLRRAKIILDKALVQLSGSPNRGLDCKEIFSGRVSKSNMALLIKKLHGRIEYVSSLEEPKLHQNSFLIGYVIRESRKKPKVISISIHFENGNCAVLDLRGAFEKEPEPYPHIKNEWVQTPPNEIINAK